MKKMTWMALTIVMAAATMATAQTDKPKMPAKPMEMKGGVNETLMQQENQMLAALQKKDIAGFKKHIMGSSWSVDENGYATVDEFLKVVGDPKANFMWEYKVSDMKVVNIDANAALVTYKVDEKGSMMGQPFPPVVYATTVWANHGGTWMAVFHQE